MVCDVTDLDLQSLLKPMMEDQVKVLTAVDKFEVARRMPKSYAKSHQVRKHVASQQRKELGHYWAITAINRESKIPWMQEGTPDYEDQLEGLDRQFNRKMWLSSSVPRISFVPRFKDDLSGANLKRFMHEKIVMEEGEGSDRVIGVTSRQLVQYLRLQEEKEREEKKAREREREENADGGME